MQITHDLAIGGLQRVVVTICKTIDREAFDVSVLCLRALGPFAADLDRLGVPVIVLPQEKRTDYLSFFKVARVLRANRIEVIHTHNTQPLLDGTLGAILSGVRRIVHTDHGRTFPDKRRYMLAERAMSHFAYRVVGVSEDTARQLIKYEHIPPSKIETIPNGIDQVPFTEHLDKEKKRRELGLHGRVPVLGLTARLVEAKGITYLLHAMRKVMKRFPEAILLIVGEGPLESALRAEAAALGISQNVEFLGPRSDTAELLRIFDIYVQPSLWEGLPMALLEAMAARCAIVATDVGGVATAIESGVNGVLVAAGDPDGLADAIVTLAQDERRRDSFAAVAFHKCQRCYAAEIMTDRYECLYRGHSEASDP